LGSGALAGALAVPARAPARSPPLPGRRRGCGAHARPHARRGLPRAWACRVGSRGRGPAGPGSATHSLAAHALPVNLEACIAHVRIRGCLSSLRAPQPACRAPVGTKPPIKGADLSAHTEGLGPRPSPPAQVHAWVRTEAWHRCALHACRRFLCAGGGAGQSTSTLETSDHRGPGRCSRPALARVRRWRCWRAGGRRRRAAAARCWAATAAARPSRCCWSACWTRPRRPRA